MADENKKQTAILESVLGELRKSNAMKREESGGDALVGGIPFGSAQFTDDIDKGFKALGKDNTESLDKVGGQLKENSEATESNASADEEDQRDKTNIFKKMTASLQGIGASLKDKAVNITKGLFGKIPFGTLFGLGIMALISFLDSKDWMMIGKWVEETIEFLKKLWKTVLKPMLSKLASFALDTAAFIDDPNWETTKKLLGDNKAVLGTLIGLLALKTFGISGIVTGVTKASGLLKAGWSSKAVTAGLAKMAPFIGVAALVGGLAMALYDGVIGWFKSDEWGVSKVAGFFGGFFGGSEAKGVGGTLKNMAGNAGKWAAIGAGLGSFIPIVGTALGAGIGAIIGAFMGYFGGDKIARGLQGLSNWIGETWDSMTEVIKGWINKAILSIKSFFQQTTAEEERTLLEDKMKATDDALAKAENTASVEAQRFKESEMVARHLAEGKKGSRSFINRQMVKNIPANQNRINQERIDKIRAEQEQLRIDYENLLKKQEEAKKQLKLDAEKKASIALSPQGLDAADTSSMNALRGSGINIDGSTNIVSKKNDTTVLIEDMHNPNAFNTAGLQHLHNPHLR